ncbi:MAG: hybrid sensor histidine kinase/response regulator, partial [Rhodobacteraceae bacterium]|nr:hybrid sensor histidine kinase/response regulator [Paracoccaceae bacterium]
TDVTQETQARAALAQTAKRELAAQLSSGLAHDFANLLTIILGLQGRLDRMEALPGEAQDLVRATLAAARRGGTLLERLAAISGPRELRPQPVVLASLLADLAAMAGPTLGPKVGLEIDVEALDQPILLDPGPLQDSLLNLMLNARDAIGPAGGLIRLEAHALRDTWAEIAVSDTGPGFSDEALERGLDPFFTTKGGEGSGLGLSMVYDQTKLAGGTVRLENTGTGARVTLRLPLRPAEAPGTPMLVLLVEDNEEIRTEVREMLRRLGHSVLETASADEAEALAALPEIGMVLSDINLQGTRSG